MQGIKITLRNGFDDGLKPVNLLHFFTLPNTNALDYIRSTTYIFFVVASERFAHCYRRKNSTASAQLLMQKSQHEFGNAKKLSFLFSPSLRIRTGLPSQSHDLSLHSQTLMQLLLMALHSFVQIRELVAIISIKT